LPFAWPYHCQASFQTIEEISKKAQTLAKGIMIHISTEKGSLKFVALSDTLNTAAVELSRVKR
jgi:hypothetical protein